MLLLAHIAFNIPYVILNVMPKFRQLNPNTYEAALDLGASPTYAFYKVIIPEIMPGILSGFLMAFTMSFDDFVISYFVRPKATVQTLPLYIYSMTGKGTVTPDMYALSTIVIVSVFVLLLISNMKSSRKNAAGKPKKGGAK